MSNASSGGISAFGLLGVIFIVLKIIDVKPIGDWSWWWVTCPFWAGLAIWFAFLLFIFGFGTLIALGKGALEVIKLMRQTNRKGK